MQATLGGLLIACCIGLFDCFFGSQLQHTCIHEYTPPPIRTYIVGSIGASTLLVFGAPHLASSKPDKIFCGHFISACIGMIISYGITRTNTGFGIVIASVLSISLAIFFMTIFNFEHPPAAGTALALATHNTAPHNEGIINFANSNIPSILVIASFILIIATILALIRNYFYFENHINSVEGIGKNVQKALDNKGFNSIPDLYEHYQDKDKTQKTIQKKIKKRLFKILSSNNNYKSYCNTPQDAKAIAKQWAKTICKRYDNNKKRKLYHCRLRDLF